MDSRGRNSCRHERLVNVVGDPIYELDEHGVLEYVNQAACRFLGYKEDELLGEPVSIAIEDEFFDACLETIQRLVKEDGPNRETVEGDVITKDGTQIPVETHLTVLMDGNEFDRTAGVLRDISDRQARIEELERYEALIEAIPEAVYGVDETGRFNFFNQAALEMYEFSEDDIDDGLHYRDVVSDSDFEDIIEIVNQFVQDPSEASNKYIVEHESIAKSGRRFTAENHFRFYRSGEIFNAVGVTLDISERKQRRQRLQVLNRILRHNLRNDMSLINGHASILEAELDDEELASRAAAIEQTGTDLVNTAETLKNVSEVVGSTGTDRGHIDAVDLVGDILDDVNEDYGDAVQIHRQFPASAPVQATSELEIAVAEVVDNAIEHNDASTPELEVEITEQGKNQRATYAIAVQDNGPGISDYERSAVLGDELSQLSHGSGIGLWAVRWVVEAFGGTLAIESDPPAGTVVTLELPKAPASHH